MENLTYGIPTIVLSTLAFLFAWRQARQGNQTLALLGLIMGGVLLRVFVSADFFLHDWDERYHALVAKNLIGQPLKPTLYHTPLLPYDYTEWTANHIWLHKQPLPLWIMASSMWIFGANELALRLPSIVFTAIGIYLTYDIGRYFFSQRTGLLAAFFYAINGLIIEIAAGRVATDHIDVFFLFFIQLSIFLSIRFAEKGQVYLNILAGISIGAAVLSKWLPALVVLPIWLLIVTNANKFSRQQIILQFTLLLFLCALTFLPWQLYIFSNFPVEARWEAGFNLKHITEVLDERTGPIYYFLDRIRINYGELIYLPLVWLFWKVLRQHRNKKLLALLIWIWVPLAFFSLVQTKMQGYILFIAPALFIITAEFWHVIADYRRRYQPKWPLNFLLILLVALPIRYAIERSKPFTNRDRSPQWVTDLKNFQNSDMHQGVLLNYPSPIEAMFYTDLTAYAQLPDSATIQGLINTGYHIYIQNIDTIPSNIKAIDGVQVVHLTLR